MTIAPTTAPAKNPARIRARQDLLTFLRQVGNESQWVVKDPISFSHYLFSPSELYLLGLFDGERSLDQIRLLWQQKFRTRALTSEQLEMLSQRFIRDKLVTVNQFGSGMQLHAEERKTKRAQWAMKLSSPLMIKLGGVDPRGVLRWLWLPGQILFNRFVMVVCLLCATAVFGYFVGHFEEIAVRAGTMAEFFSAKNLLLMTVIIFAVKVLHELGHAVACRKFGGECFEIGVLLLVFFPTLYCDVTDSWTFAERWKRMVVSFAGIYIEILLATVAAGLWLLTDPGLANSIFFNIAVMGSVNTLFINGNPLLRYDGYYILSDLFEQPNLAENSKQSFRRWLARFFCNVPPTVSTQSVSAEAWLALFGCCSVLYRGFVIISIAIGVSLLLQRFEFGAVGDGMVLMLLASIGYRMLKQRRGASSPVWHQINLARSVASLMVIGLLVLGLFYLPIPSYRYCNFVVETQHSAVIYAPQDGQLELLVQPYVRVDQGTPIGDIIQPELGEQHELAARQLAHLEERAKRLVRRFEQSPTVASDVQLLRNETEKVKAQVENLAEERQSLKLASPLLGMIRPLPLTPPPSLVDDETPTMSGTYFDQENKNCFVRRGQPLLVVEGAEKRLVSYLGERDVEYLAVGQAAVVSFDPIPHQLFSGRIAEIIEIDVQLNASETESSGMETFVDQIGKTHTVQTPYRVIMTVDDLPEKLLVGSNGRSRVSVPMQTLAAKAWALVEHWWQARNY